LLASLDTLYTAWVPHEVIYTSIPQTPVVVGYVLSDDNGHTTFLTTGIGGHGIQRIDDTQVLTEKICERRPYNAVTEITDARTLWELLTEIKAFHRFGPAPNLLCPNN
jgi:hypothetical protein